MPVLSRLLGLVVVSVFLCSACAPTLTARINSFRAPGPLITQAAVSVAPSGPEQQKSLEFGLYQAQLEQALRQQGFTVVSAGQGQYVARLHYGVKRLEQGRGGGVQTGMLATTGRSGLGLGTQVLVLDEPKNVPWYERSVSLVIAENTAAGAHVYEATAVSEGRCGVMSEVFGAMLQALFVEFPAANGSVKSVTVKTASNCK